MLTADLITILSDYLHCIELHCNRTGCALGSPTPAVRMMTTEALEIDILTREQTESETQDYGGQESSEIQEKTVEVMKYIKPSFGLHCFKEMSFLRFVLYI